MKIKEVFTNLFNEQKKCEVHHDCVEYKQMQAYLNRSNDTCAKRIERSNVKIKSLFDKKIADLEKKYGQLLESLDHQGCVKKSYTESQ